VDLTTLAALVGNAIIAAIATDSWERVRASVVQLWRQIYPHRADAIDAVLTETRDELVLALEQGNAVARDELAAEWQRRIRSLLAAREDAAPEVQRLLDQVLTPILTECGQQIQGSLSFAATASGDARVYQSGRDQFIIHR
jgi:hypothetical protein